MPVALAVLAVLGALPVGAQAPRSLTLLPGVRITAREMVWARGAVTGDGPDGCIVLAGRGGWGEVKGYDSTGKPLPWKLAVGRGNDAEILYPSRIGWINGTSTMWVSDPGYSQVALVDARGKVTKSIETPSWLHPHWADRRRFPVFAAMEPLAMYRDSSMLVMPFRERSFLDTPGYDHSVQHLLRVSWSGAIQKDIAALPLQQGSITASGPGGSEHTVVIPFAAHTLMATSSDGMRVVIATPGVATSDSGTIRVTALDDRGDTVFSRRYPQPVARIPQAAIDRFLGNVRAFGSSSAEQLRTAAAAQIPTFRSFLTTVLVGRDHSTWLVMRPAVDSLRERNALILDAGGDLVGIVTIPAGEAPIAVNRAHVWALAASTSRSPTALVRYTVAPTAAPPARSGRGSASSRPLRPPA